MSELPKKWVECELGDIVKIHNGYAFPSKEYQDNGVPLIRQSNLDGDKVSLKNCAYLNPKYLETKKEFILRKNDVLIGMSGSLGKLCIYDLDLPALQNQRTGKILPYSPIHIEWKFIWQYLQTVEYKLIKIGKGLGISNISADDIESLPFKLPPLNEQRLIVEKLEKLLHKVNDCQERLEKIPAILKCFRQSILATACSGRLTADWREKNPDVKSAEKVLKRSVILSEAKNLKPLKDETLRSAQGDNFRDAPHSLQEGWQWQTVEQLLPKGGIFDGPFGSNLKTSDYTASGVRVIRLENIGHLRFIVEKETYISHEKYETLRKHTVGKDDIIFASFIDEEIRVCLLPKLKDSAIAKADCFCLRPDKKLVDRQYLIYQLASYESYKKLFEVVHGATRPRINTTQLRKLEIRICPLPEQQEIVRRVEALFKKADEIEERYKKAKEFVDKLTQSILAKAFRGELVPQDPNDEPASVLLERIRAEKEKQSAKMQRKPPKTFVERRLAKGERRQ